LEKHKNRKLGHIFNGSRAFISDWKDNYNSAFSCTAKMKCFSDHRKNRNTKKGEIANYL
jgi:hypothetical protein